MLTHRLLCRILLGSILGVAVQAGEEAPPPRSISIQPILAEKDPGPEIVVGAEGTQGSGTSFLWTDIQLEGEGVEYRLYFDRADNDNTHLLDRHGSHLVLSLREGGAEQLLWYANLPQNEPGPLRVARHGSRIGIFWGKRWLGSAFDDRRLGGTVGVRRFNGGPVLSLKAEAREEIHFQDDFMHEDQDSFSWRKLPCADEQSDFAVKTLRNPSMSANAFYYMGTGSGAWSVAGQPWWDNYRLEAALHGPEKSRIGLVFAFQDEKNYGLFRWTARPVRSDGSTEGPGERELLLVREGKETVLAQAPGGFLPGQWYQAEVTVDYSRVNLRVDGQPFFEVSNPYLAAGAVGVWCDVPHPTRTTPDPKSQPLANSLHDPMTQSAVFDDVRVNSVEGFEDDFREAGPLSHGWLVGLGDWTVHAQAGRPGELRVHPNGGPTKSLIGNRSWAQYRMDCDVDPGSGTAGLVFLYRDESNHYLARLNAGALELVRVSDGSGSAQEAVIDRTELKPAQSPFRHLSLMVQHGYIQVQAEEGSRVEAFEQKGTPRGRAGLLAAPPSVAAAEPSPARFQRFRLWFLEEPEPLVTTNAIFEDESSMKDWSSPSGEWIPPRTPIVVNGEKVDAFWHLGQFPGDVELTVEPREISEDRHEVALSVAKDGKGANNGYIFRYRSEPKGSGQHAVTLAMEREGKTVAEGVLSDEDTRELSTLSLRRAGHFLAGKVNGRVVLLYRDPQPLTGAKVAYYSRGLEIRSESAKIVSEHFHNEPFARAPVDWRTAGFAIAEVANRWQCDPRWSFFSLKNDRTQGKPAVLWSKRLYPGDVTVEFFVGNKMEQERGRPYTYARDINVTICSDGSDLTKGYTFMFGGQDNSGSMICRDGVEVKRVPVTIPTDMNKHHWWFAIRVEKRENRLSFRVDSYFSSEKEGELVYEDERPLTGNRVAIWTYDHAVMISRVRISGEGGIECEAPDAEIPPLRTPYTLQEATSASTPAKSKNEKP